MPWGDFNMVANALLESPQFKLVFYIVDLEI